MGDLKGAPYEGLRQAGLLERYHITRCELGLDTTVFVSATYSTANNTRLDRPTVLRALKKVVLAYPALCVRLDIKPREIPRYVRIPSVDVNDVLEFSEDPSQSPEHALALQLAKPFDTKSALPLWRLLIHADNTAVFVFHHGIGDGTSAQAFHHAFHSALNNSAPGADNSVDASVVTPPELHLEQPIEKLTNISVSFKKFCQTMRETFAPPSWRTGHRAWTANPVVSEPHFDVRLRLRTIESPEATALIDLCRRHSCTLTTFLRTLATLILSHILTKHYPQELKKRHKLFTTSVAISLRRFTGLSALSMADHVSAHFSYARIQRSIAQYPFTKESFPWQAAADYRKSLERNLKKSREVIGTIRYIHILGISQKYFLDHLGKKREDTIQISNIGLMPKGEPSTEAKGEAQWSIGDMFFGQSDCVLGAAIKMNVAGSPTGSVTIGYTWGRGAIGDELMEMFIKDLHEAITLIVTS